MPQSVRSPKAALDRYRPSKIRPLTLPYLPSYSGEQLHEPTSPGAHAYAPP